MDVDIGVAVPQARGRGGAGEAAWPHRGAARRRAPWRCGPGNKVIRTCPGTAGGEVAKAHGSACGAAPGGRQGSPAGADAVASDSQHFTGIATPTSPPESLPSRTSPLGTILACAILISIRMGRMASEEERLDRRSMEARYMKAMGANKELAQLRKKYEEQEAQRKAELTAQRVKEAQRKAEEADIERQERERRYKEEQDREAAKLRSIQEAKRREFEEKERTMQEELNKRAETEKKIIQEMELKKKEEAERLRIEAERQALLEEQERKRAEADERRRLEEEERKRRDEKAALERLKKKFAVRAEGYVIVRPAPAGAVTAGPFKDPAKVQMEVSMSTALAPEAQMLILNCTSPEDAQQECGELAGTVSRTIFDRYKSAVRLQAMTSSGALEHMDEIELEHWMRRASLRTEDTAAHGLAKALKKFKQGQGQEIRDKFEVRTEWGVLPEGNESRTDALLASGIGRLNESGGALAVRDLLKDMMEDEKATFCKGMKSAECSYASEACTLAQFTDRALQTRDQNIADAAGEIVRAMLQGLAKGAPKDSLLPISKSLIRAMGSDHPVAALFSVIAEANLSTTARAAIKERQRAAEARLAAQVLEEQWPDRDEIVAARVKERDESTPVPERVWALRNVARTLSIGAPSASATSQATDLLTKAVKLQEQHLGTSKHPGMLPVLYDLSTVLLKVPESRSDAAGVVTTILEILKELGERYQRQADMASAVICMESGVLEGERVLGERHPLLRSMSRTVEKWYKALEPAERDMVSACRKSGEGMTRVAAAFTPELGAYRIAGKVDRIEAWSKNERLEPL
ncbi:unnamed protein product [Ostreobium quekettii]|uniref:Uncharacterized protein n=1 Tax=Ostreobium quekettii TaxID=121088 RepID=A0A8S1JBC5_9CHLO|nr:unnamed protein product [Ostreobium quekettii]|eukprot:evm.model.scf_44.5 EVM.evm.TU.scf_44.5   scf_44:89984-101852(+)